ncbi:MAG: hypothetical protein ABI378_00920 [Chitinophagaceae bacterium]
MSEEQNNPASENPQGQSQKPASTYKPITTNPAPVGPPKKNFTWVFLGIIALLLGTNVYLYMNKNKIAGEKQDAIVTRDSVITSRDELNTEYQAAITRLDQLNTTNNQLSNEIKDKDGALQKMRSELQGIMSKEKRTAADDKKAHQLIAQLNDKVASYESRISELEGQNKQLTTDKQALTSENSNLSGKVKLGAVLHASNIRLEAINLRRHGTKESETSKARKADLLRITFDIDENRIAESGAKEIFLRITAPDGRLLSNAAYGSGITSLDDGQQLSYTLSKQITLVTNTPVKDISIDWKQDSEFEKGTYVIDLYNSGLRIGGGSVALR